MPNEDLKTPNPSTYRQVIENMRQILEQATSIEDAKKMVNDMSKILTEQGDTIKELTDMVGDVKVTELPYTIKEMADKVKELNDKLLEATASSGDVITTDDGMKIIGIHTNTTNVNVNLTADAYKQGLTVELKSTSAIGLEGKTGMSNPYCFLLTMVKDTAISGETADVSGYKPMQVAFANNAMYLYCRFANSDNSWGGWKEREEQTIDVRQQFVESKTQPTDQRENEYWFEPLQTTSGT